MRNRFLWIMALCGCLMVSCNDDSIQNTGDHNPPEEEIPGEDPNVDNDDPTPDPDTDNPGSEVSDLTDNGDGTSDDGDTEPGVTCDEICEIGVHRCAEGGSQVCERIHECPNWGSVTPCDNCDEDTGECKAECPQTCTDGEKKCEGNAVWSCDADANGCMQWVQTEACGEDKICSDTFTCITGCKDECSENDTRCADNGMQKCVVNTQGCRVWQKDAPCETGKICSADSKQCEYACGNDCEPFSIFLIPDTQYYTQSYRLSKNDGKTTAAGKKITNESSLMTQQMKWIVEKQQEMNTRFVIHLGDITNTNHADEWVNAANAMKKLAAASIPFSMGTGNHDYLDKPSLLPSRSKTKFPDHFTDEKMKDYFKGTALADMKWFGGYHYGTNSYSTFSVGNLHFMVIAFEFYPRKDVIAWADTVLNDPKFSDYHIIVETHGYLTTKAKYCGQRKDAHTHYQAHGMGGKALFDEFVQRHSNIFLVVGGHVSDSEYITHNNLFGTPVHEILVDYQSEAPCQGKLCAAGTCDSGKINSGNGWFRQLIIDPKTGHVTGKTHSVIGKDKYSYGSNNPKPHMFCTGRYVSDASTKDHVNDFTFDITPAKHKYSDKDIYGFVPRNINNQGSGDQVNPVVAMHRSEGSFVAVWEDNSSKDDGTYKDAKGKEQNNFDIAFRLFNKGGYANGGQKYVTADNKVAKGNQVTPDIAMDAKGNFVIVWADDSNNDNSYEVRMSGFNAKGEITFSNVRVSDSKANQTLPKIAMTSDGSFVVVWNEQAGSAKINAQMRSFAPDGKAIGEAKYIIGQTEGTRRNPDVAMDDNGNYVVSWDDDNDNNGTYQLHAQKYDFNGNAIGKTLTVNSESAGQQINSAIGMNAKGDFYVAYRDDRDKDKKYAIRVRGWDENLKEIITDTEFYNKSHNNTQPTVCVDDSGNAIVGLYDSNMSNCVSCDDAKERRDDTVAGDVIVGTISGGKIGKTVSPTTLVWNNQKQPSVSCSGDGHVVVVYADDADGNGAYEVYGRGFNAIGDIGN